MTMAKKKIERNPAAEKIAQAILEAYEPGSVEDMQSALKEVFGPHVREYAQGRTEHTSGI